MDTHRLPVLLALLLAAGLAAEAAEPPVADHPAKPVGKRMKMDEPMAGKMMKPGMTKGDVKKAAAAKADALKPMMAEEEKAMPTPRAP